MSKERLEETENKMVEFRQLLALVTGHNDILNKAAHIHEIVTEQAERVQETERDNEYLRGTFIPFLQDNIKELERQNKRYREVIDKLNNPPPQHEHTAETYAHYVVSILKALEESDRYISLLDYAIEQAERAQELKTKNQRYRDAIANIKQTSKDFRNGHLLDIQDSFFVDEIIAIIDNLEGEE